MKTFIFLFMLLFLFSSAGMAQGQFAKGHWDTGVHIMRWQDPEKSHAQRIDTVVIFPTQIITLDSLLTWYSSYKRECYADSELIPANVCAHTDKRFWYAHHIGTLDGFMKWMRKKQ